MEIEGLHVLILILTAGMILYADHDALSYLRGKKQVLNARVTSWLHRGVWVGLALMIVTGFFMMFPAREHYLTDPAFLVKMCMVAALVSNGLIIGQLSHIATKTPFRELPTKTKVAFFISGAVSSGCWLGATTIGMFFL